MLVLSRKQKQWVRLTVPPSDAPTQIAVCFVEHARGGKIRLGFSAPPRVSILRDDALDQQPPAASIPAERA